MTAAINNKLKEPQAAVARKSCRAFIYGYKSTDAVLILKKVTLSTIANGVDTAPNPLFSQRSQPLSASG